MKEEWLSFRITRSTGNAEVKRQMINEEAC
jgi:hypothetical protein